MERANAQQSVQGGGPRHAGGGNGQVSARIAAALIQLADAQRCAVADGQNVWEFAIEIGILGLHPTDLRSLIHKGLVQHGWEITRAGAKNRSFRLNMGVTLSQRSCFVATAAGLSLASACSAAAGADKGPSQAAVAAGSNGNGHPHVLAGPHWDSGCREFYLDGVLVKKFRRPAPNQERILLAFQEDGWPSSIDDPLPPNSANPDQDGKSRLHYTIRSLNRCQKNRLVHFEGNGSGQCVAWKRVKSHPRRCSRQRERR